MAKLVVREMDSYPNIWYSYAVDTFNQTLDVKLRTKVHPDLHAGYLKEAISEAYDHYNLSHPNAEFIHPSAIV